VWTENVPLALEVALGIKAGTVWINCHNLFDAAAGFGGYKQSGFGRDGGKEARAIIIMSGSDRFDLAIKIESIVYRDNYVYFTFDSL
jgi:aldehyde dehydrogenase (NAD+)